MIWFDGQLTHAASIDATNAGALLGWGVFTTLAIRGGAPRLWDLHAARLKRDAHAARVEFSFDETQLRAGLDELLAALDLKNGLARITGIRRGDGRWNNTSGAHWSISAQVAATPSNEPLKLEVSPFRVAAKAPLAGVKTTSYLSYLVAWQAAQQRGFDEAILLTENGWVCETARASIFWAKAGALYTPSLQCGCLRGVGREFVLACHGAQQGKFRLRSLLEADECFVVSGAAGLRPIGSIRAGKNRREFGASGPLTVAIGQMIENDQSC